MSPRARSSQSKDGSVAASTSSALWKYTKVMNMRDLARDDDYLSHLFVEKLGMSTTPLMVHKMDPLRRLPKTDAADVLEVVQRIIHARPTGPAAVKQAVNELLVLPAVRYYIRDYEQCQINAFATHASRYLELYLPTGSIEIAQTSRYSKWTGKNELCILATRAMAPGTVITELKGSMADLTDDEDKELKKTGARNDGGVRRDFSVIHSKQLKKNHLFLGPARFVNHDCDHNCELFRTGRYITFRVIKPIAVGQEITAHYGDGYFGRNNRHCLCETCERLGKGGYCPQPDIDDIISSSSSSDSDFDSDSDTSSVASIEPEKENVKLNVNQRSTRRGVYLTLPDNERANSEADVKIEMDREADTDGLSELTPAPSSAPLSTLSRSSAVTSIGLLGSRPGTPDSKVTTGKADGHAQSQTPSSSPSTSSPGTRTNYKSLIVTRGQKAREVSFSNGNSQLVTPPLSDVAETASASDPCLSDVPSGSAKDTGPAKPTTPQSERVLRSSRSEPLPSPPVVRRRGRPRKNPANPADKGKVKDDQDKEKSQEKRVLRGRPSLPIVLSSKNGDASATTSGVLSKGKRVKKVPTCITCSTPLPLPVVDGSVRPTKWNRKGKVKDILEDCTRCQRHLVIYGAPWPQRNAAGFIPTPREGTPVGYPHKVSQKDLPILDRKLQAMSSPLKRQRDESGEREPKRRKKSAKNDVQKPGRGRYARAKLLGRGMQRIPALKVRGRPKAVSKIEHDSSIEDLKDQPRDSNGRFGKKASTNGRYGRRKAMTASAARLSRAQRGMQSRMAGRGRGRRRQVDDGEVNRGDALEQPSASVTDRGTKRAKGTEMADDPPPSKRARDSIETDLLDDRRDKNFWPVLPALFPYGLGFKKLGLLNMRPNPAVVSRWRSSSTYSSQSPESTPTLVDDSTDDDRSDDHPATPDDIQVATPSGGTTPRSGKHYRDATHVRGTEVHDVIEVEDSDEEEFDEDATPLKPIVLPALRRFGLFSKPSPLALSKRAWATKVLVDDADNEPSEGAQDNYSRSSFDKASPSRASRSQDSPPDVEVMALQDLCSDTCDAGEVAISISEVFAHSDRLPFSHPSRNLFDVDATSSGEEDVILPGSTASRRFALQKSAAFAAVDHALDTSASLCITAGFDSEHAAKIAASNASPLVKAAGGINISAVRIHCLSQPLKDTALDIPKDLIISTPLHSSFLPSAVLPSKLIDAGWDSGSEEPQIV